MPPETIKAFTISGWSRQNGKDWVITTVVTPSSTPRRVRVGHVLPPKAAEILALVDHGEPPKPKG